jgi:hypothetical protein
VSVAVVIAAAATVLFFVVLYVALGQLTGQRRKIATRYVALALLSAVCVVDWLSGATERVMIEGWMMVVLIPIGIAHLATMLWQESR